MQWAAKKTRWRFDSDVPSIAAGRLLLNVYIRRSVAALHSISIDDFSLKTKTNVSRKKDAKRKIVSFKNWNNMEQRRRWWSNRAVATTQQTSNNNRNDYISCINKFQFDTWLIWRALKKRKKKQKIEFEKGKEIHL